MLLRVKLWHGLKPMTVQGVEAAINRSAKRKLLGKSKLPWLVLMCYWHGTTSCLSTKKT